MIEESSSYHYSLPKGHSGNWNDQKEKMFLFEGSKAFNKVDCTLDVYIRKSENFNVVEVIAYNPVTSLESNHIYLNLSKVRALIPSKERIHQSSMSSSYSSWRRSIDFHPTDQWLVRFILNHIEVLTLEKKQLEIYFKEIMNDEDDEHDLWDILCTKPYGYHAVFLKSHRKIPIAEIDASHSFDDRIEETTCSSKSVELSFATLSFEENHEDDEDDEEEEGDGDDHDRSILVSPISERNITPPSFVVSSSSSSSVLPVLPKEKFSNQRKDTTVSGIPPSSSSSHGKPSHSRRTNAFEEIPYDNHTRTISSTPMTNSNQSSRYSTPRTSLNKALPPILDRLFSQDNNNHANQYHHHPPHHVNHHHLDSARRTLNYEDNNNNYHSENEGDSYDHGADSDYSETNRRSFGSTSSTSSPDYQNSPLLKSKAVSEIILSDPSRNQKKGQRLPGGLKVPPLVIPPLTARPPSRPSSARQESELYFES